MTSGVIVIALIASRRQSEANMVKGDAAELGAKPLDQMSKFKGPSRIPVYEYDSLALALVDKVHPVPGRRSEKFALKRIHVVRQPVRTTSRPISTHGRLYEWYPAATSG